MEEIGSTWFDHLLLVGKRLVDFLLYSANWTFSPAVTVEEL